MSWPAVTYRTALGFAGEVPIGQELSLDFRMQVHQMTRAQLGSVYFGVLMARREWMSGLILMRAWRTDDLLASWGDREAHRRASNEWERWRAEMRSGQR